MHANIINSDVIQFSTMSESVFQWKREIASQVISSDAIEHNGLSVSATVRFNCDQSLYERVRRFVKQAKLRLG